MFPFLQQIGGAFIKNLEFYSSNLKYTDSTVPLESIMGLLVLDIFILFYIMVPSARVLLLYHHLLFPLPPAKNLHRRSEGETHSAYNWQGTRTATEVKKPLL